MQPKGPSEPWAFTQEPPLTTQSFAKAAEQRGITIDDYVLRELWRIGALEPAAEIRNRAIGTSQAPTIAEAHHLNSWSYQIRLARDEGRLADPHALGFRHQLLFSRPGASATRWFNGLFYSRWQLRTLRWARRLFEEPPLRRPRRLRALSSSELEDAAAFRRTTDLLIAAEARYLPEVRSPWLHIANVDADEWATYREGYDPNETLARFGWTSDQVGEAADGILRGIRRWEPAGEAWSALVRRASNQAWGHLRGDMLAALDDRLAAEILFRFYEDLSRTGSAVPLNLQPGWYREERERIGHLPESLDSSLSALGLSPHPGVVLIVEGETEESLLPRVIARMELDDNLAIVRSSVMRGTQQGLVKLVGFVATPLLERQERPGSWLLRHPPTHVLVAIDPDPPFDSPEKVEAQRGLMVTEIRSILSAQGCEALDSEIDGLVEIRTWPDGCFEFAHFSDEELADGLLAVHDCNGLTQAQLIAGLAGIRRRRGDIKILWKGWPHHPRKLALADQLWPHLDRRIQIAIDTRSQQPGIAAAVQAAFASASQRHRSGRWVLRST